MSLDRNQLEKSVNKLRSLLSKQDWTSPKRIHRFRTQARRFEASVEALGLRRKGNQERLLRKLARLRKLAGGIRDMDVFTACVLTVSTENDQDCAVQLVEHLGASRYSRARKIRQCIRRDRKALRRGLKRSPIRVLSDPRKSSGKDKTLAPTEAMANALKLAAQLKTPARLTRRTLHAYRLKVKELRDVLQLSRSADQQKFIDQLGEVKDAIGEWHDWEELSSIATKLLNHGRTCGLQHELRAVSDARYNRALSLANEMRNTYLPWKAHPGTSKRKQTRRLARPVLVAASAVAE